MLLKRTLLSPDDLYSKRIHEFSSNLVAHWPLDELSGTTAYDKTGRNDGAITGTTLGQAGIGDGLTSQYFDGTNDYIDISAIASNLIANGGFETAGGGGADIWASWTESVTDGALANEGVVIHTGADACKITAGAGANTIISGQFATIPEATYRFRFWSQGDGTHDGRYSLYDVTNGGWIRTTIGTGVTGAAYAMVDYNFTAPAGCIAVQPYFWCPATDTAFCYFDTVSLRRTDVPTFDPHEGSMIVWAKVPIGAWTDNTTQYLIGIGANAQNSLGMYVYSAGNRIDFFYEGNDTKVSYNLSPYSRIDWVPYGITWSLSGDLVTYYIDGSSVGTPDTGLGIITGNLASAGTLIGAASDTPTASFLGNLAHVILSNTAWDADTMKYLMSLP